MKVSIHMIVLSNPNIELEIEIDLRQTKLLKHNYSDPDPSYIR